MATITKTIGTSGRDYSTVTLWEADLDDGGIYSASDDAVGEMYNDSTFSERWTIDGGATIGLNSITLTVAESERHDGTAGTGVRFIQSASWKCQVTTTVPTHLSWFEMDGNSTVNNNTMLSHTRDGTINHLILHNHTTSWNSTVLSASGHNLDTTLSNCIVYDFVNSAPSGKSVVIVNQGVASGAGNITGANLTIHGCYSTGDSPTVAYTLSDNYATRTGQNILITDCDVCFGISSYSKATVNHNASSDATASGTGSLTNIVTADQYVSTVSGSEDLHLKLGSDCIGAGIDLGTTDDVQFDIDGYDRDTNAVTWDIGADQFVALGDTYDETGSGGGELGETGELYLIYNLTGSSNGVELAGVSNISFFKEHIPSGGVEIGGETDVSLATGIAVGGESVNNVFAFDVGVGGLEISGKSLLIYETIFGSGGIESAGDVVETSFIPGTGGAELSGEVIVDFFDKIDGEGGIVAGGKADVVSSETITDVLTPVSGSNDGYWTSLSGAFNSGDNLFFVGNESALGEIRAFVRFPNVPIPSGSTIQSASLTFRAKGTVAGNPSVRVYFNSVDNATAPTSKAEADLKTLTTNNSGVWNVDNSAIAGTVITSPDITLALQEVINRGGWFSGNALMAIIKPETISGDNYQTLASEEDTLYASPQLNIEYTTGSITEDEGSGSIIASGQTFNILYTSVGQGAIVAAGTSEVNPAERFIGDGGLVAGGQGLEQTDADIDITGGVELNGFYTGRLVNVIGADGAGVEIGGTTTVQYGLIGSGGAVLAGQASLLIVDYIEETLDGEGVVVGGRGLLEVRYGFVSSGGLTTSSGTTFTVNYNFVSLGQNVNAPPDFAGVSVGYQNSENPTIVSVEWDIQITSRWSVDTYVQFDKDILWNTGRLPLYFYRVVSKPVDNDICNLAGDCCQRFVVNVPARSITDLCLALKSRRWKWPVLTVEKFTRSAESTGDEDECLELVEICNNVVCEDFCVDYDLKETWGTITKHQLNAFYTSISSGQVNISGVSGFSVDHDGFNFFCEGHGEVTLEGEARALSNFVEGEGGAVLSGVATAISSSWYYIGGEWPFNRELSPQDVDQFVYDVSDRVWNTPDNAKISDDAYAYADTSNGVATKYLVVRHFNFDVPEDAIIVGIEASIERQSTGSVKDNAVYLLVGEEIVSDNMASGTIWPIGSDSTMVYGGLGTVWRDPDGVDYLGDWNVADINNVDFGLAIRVAPTIGQVTSESRIDNISLKVYWELPNQHLLIGGAAKSISDNYRYESEEDFVSVGGEIPLPIVGYVYRSTGRGSVGPAFAGATFGGSYATRFDYSATEGVEISGEAETYPGGLQIGGLAHVESTRNFAISSGGFELASVEDVYIRLLFDFNGGIGIGGDAGINNKFVAEGNGGLIFSGAALWSSNSYHFSSDGNFLFVSGTASTNFSDFGTIETNIGFISTVLYEAIRFVEESTPVDSIPDTTITECSCSAMDMIMPMTHNFINNNKFAQFLSRNNLDFSRVVGLKWSKVNSCWIFNRSFEGYSDNGQNRELWSVIFQLQCTSFVGGDLLNDRIWRFSAQILQKNLLTLEDYDTKIVVGFLPENACDDLGFNIDINIDTQSDFVLLNPEGNVYEFKLHDNIKLFSNQYWLKKPNLKFELSQIGVDEFVERYPLVIS